MYVVVRHYRASPALIDELVKLRDEVQATIESVPGFVAYYLVRTADGGASISIFEDKEGTDETSRRAAAFIGEKLPEIAASAPELIEGEAVIQFTS